MPKRRNGLVAIAVATVLLAAGLAGQDAGAEANAVTSKLPPTPPRVDAKVEQMDTTEAKQSEAERAEAERPAPAPAPPVWPEPNEETVQLAGAGKAATALTKSAIRLATTAGRAKSPLAAASAARVRVLDRSKADAADVSGFLLTVARADGAVGESPAQLTVDYSSFAEAFGGGWASRLELIALPACALTTPDKPGCLASTPVGSVNNQQTKILSAPVSLAGEERVMAVTAAPASGNGDYGATSLGPASTWSAGRNSGDFTWNYPLRVPPAPAGPAPSLSIDYSAQSVDGTTAATNSQPSWIGEGFSLSESYIERKYMTCDDDGQTGKNDLCWKYDNATLMLNGQGSELVKDTSGWRLKNDDGSKVERKVTSTGTDGDEKEQWLVTTLDGTKYHFGVEHVLAGANDPGTNSVWTVPVAGNNSGEPCHKATFAASFCDNQEWRWNLDYVEDPRGNAMSLWYDKETNYYAKNGETAATKTKSYTRGGYPTKILYGQRADAMTASAPLQVQFVTQERCTANCSTLDSTTKGNWPDVPFDQICAAGATCTKTGPSFFSRRRLEQITTQVRKGNAYQNVDHWQLGHSFPNPGDDMSGKALWLTSITHSGVAPGSSTATPLKVSFGGFTLPNRVDSDKDGISPLRKYRVDKVWTETGAKVTVNYAEPECAGEWPGKPAKLPTSPASNVMRCYPVHWQPPQSEPRDDWFHRHVVTQVRVNDVTGGADAVVTNYSYGGGGAWHYQENALILKKERNWSEWRGFRTVTTSAGDPLASGSRSRTVTSYFRGMNGDRASVSGGTKSVSIPDTKSGSRVDAPALAGLVREAITFADSGSNTEVVGSLTDYWVHETAAQTIDAEAGLVRRANLVKPSTVTARTVRGGDRPDLMHTATTTYDPDTGLAVTAEDQGDPGKSNQTCTVTSYAKSATMRSYVSRVVASKGQCDEDSDNPPENRLIADQRNLYDKQSFGVAPTEGNLTSSERVGSYLATGSPSYQTISTTAYDKLGRPTESTDALKRKSTTEYFPADAGALERTISTSPPVAPGNPNSAVLKTESTYRPEWGTKSQTVDPNGKVTDVDYDSLGRLTAVWLPNQSKADKKLPNMRYTYAISPSVPSYVRTDDLNVNADGYLSGFAIYDSLLRSRQTQAVAPNGGRLISETKYNTRGLPVVQNSDLWNSSAPSGTLAAVLDTAVPSQRILTYDGVGRQTVATFATSAQPRWSTRTVYDGDTIISLPPNGAPATAEIKDARGRVIERREYDGPTVTTGFIPSKYTYDARGQLAQMTTAGSTWSFGYDLLGRKTSSTDPDSGKTSYEYDAADRLVAVTGANQKKLITTYDNLNRKTTVHEGSKTDTGLRLSWDYDPAGNLGQIYQSNRYPTGKAGAVYRSRVTKRNVLYKPEETFLIIPDSEGPELAASYRTTTAYAPDAESVAWTQIPGGGSLGSEVLNFTYNNLGQPTSMKSGDAVYVNGVSYTAVGDPERYDLGGQQNMPISNSFEVGTRRLLNSSSGVDKFAANHIYSYDPAGNLLKDDNKVGGDSQCYKYDGHARLTEAWSPSNTDCAAAPSVAGLGGPAPYWQSWAFTASGLRQTQTEHSSTGDTKETYAYDTVQPHTLKSVTTTGASPKPTATYDYDVAGNTTTRPDPSSGVQALTWNAENKLEKLENVAGDTAYVYDADGTLILRKSPDETILYVGSLEITFDKKNKALSSKREYAINSQTVAVRSSTTDLDWLIPDHHGTSSVAVDSQTLVATRRYTTPFGEPRGTEPFNWPDNHGFLGKPEDKTTGLTHIGAREYDPGIGSFISVDPIMDPSDPHQMLGYTYGSNNPATVSDPTGLQERLEPGGGTCNGPCPTPGGSTTGGSTTGGSTGGTNQGGGGDEGGGGHDNNNTGRTGPMDRVLEYVNDKFEGKGSVNEEFGEGFIVAALESAKGTWDLAVQTRACLGFDRASCGISRQDTGVMARDPQAAISKGVKAAALGFYEPVKDDVVAGNPGRAFGRIAAFAAEMFLGSKGATKLLKIGKMCSFAGATAVLMADGTHKPIREIRPGDKVIATDPETGRRAARVVLQTWVHDDTLMDLSIDDGKITTTEDHPFWSVTDGRFERADELAPGERVLSTDRRSVRVSGLAPQTSRGARAFNLTVADIHTYYVLAGNTPVLVHNAGPGCGTYPNKMRGTLEQELALADKLGVTPAGPGSAGFDSAINSGTVKWAVRKDGNLVVIPKFVDGKEISHAALTRGDAVRAAGEADIAGSNGGYFGLEINNHSGHFEPPSESLQVGRDAFASAGVDFG
ncbi:RHS repeat-associated core domain-containing protein [Kribbella albertanoniae]|uniref:Hint domain-containing protein n=1 Tax=Kribbella albertanoniae TaxID=1266829 RepID=A0A4R4P903_9ACTN|nr:polymorphic toxin-type HINT domain-containing protein [Kribbella albertanoniae]TDC18529.1 hypothetical protein E1261_35315 [Kribbella albertanoniae]